MKREMTEAQKAAAAEVRAVRAEMMARVKNMSDADRERLANENALLSTVEGHVLSVRNRALLALQAATRGVRLETVGGFDQWKRAGRSVNKGEKSFWIAFPRVGKDEEENEVLRGFSVATVFDKSQTHEMTEEERAAYGKRRARRAAADRPAAAEVAEVAEVERPAAVAPVASPVASPVAEVPAPVASPAPVAPGVDMSAIMAAFAAAS